MDNRKTIVVAEDEFLVRMDVVEALHHAGFDVIEADSADAVLALLATRSGDVHVLFTDIHMPGSMNGIELSRRVNRDWPGVALLITSGALRPRQEELPALAVFIKKPYQPAHVVQRARELASIQLPGGRP